MTHEDAMEPDRTLTAIVLVLFFLVWTQMSSCSHLEKMADCQCKKVEDKP